MDLHQLAHQCKIKKVRIKSAAAQHRAAQAGIAGFAQFQQGLITLKEDASMTMATKIDIEENPLGLDIQEVEAAQLPRSLADVDLAVINGNYAIQAGLNAAEDALAIEDKDSEAIRSLYANVLVVKEGNEEAPVVQALIECLQSEEVRAFMEEEFGGAVIPMF